MHAPEPPRPTDLLKKPFLEVNKLELKGGSKPIFVAEAVLGGEAKDINEKHPALSVKAENFVYGQFKVDKLVADTNAIVSAEFSLSEAFQGTKLTFAGVDKTRATVCKPVLETVFGVEHRADFGTFTLSADPLDYSAKASALAGSEGFFGGASVAVKSRPAVAFPDYNVALGYKSKAAAYGITTDKAKVKGADGKEVDVPFQFAVASFYQVRRRAARRVGASAARGPVPPHPALPRAPAPCRS